MSGPCLVLHLETSAEVNAALEWPTISSLFSSSMPSGVLEQGILVQHYPNSSLMKLTADRLKQFVPAFVCSAAAACCWPRGILLFDNGCLPKQQIHPLKKANGKDRRLRKQGDNMRRHKHLVSRYYYSVVFH